MEKQKIDFEVLFKDLPPIICRDQVEDLLGGIIRAKRLANLDSLNEGPPRRFRIGRKVAYETGPFLKWLTNRSEVLK